MNLTIPQSDPKVNLFMGHYTRFVAQGEDESKMRRK
jgi:hypothetical protein